LCNQERAIKHAAQPGRSIRFIYFIGSAGIIARDKDGCAMSQAMRNHVTGEFMNAQRTQRVLVVDDDDQIREATRDTLEEDGYRVSLARDGAEALKIMRAARDRLVVLLDLRMPGLDGAGVLGVMAGDRTLAHQHAVILMTADNRTMTLAFANLLTQLEVPVLKKPWDLDDLLASVVEAEARLGA
jgi:CheY-like chemotaxis protein